MSSVQRNHKERLIVERLYSLGGLTPKNPDNPYSTIALTSGVINVDSHIYIVFPIIQRYPRNKC